MAPCEKSTTINNDNQTENIPYVIMCPNMQEDPTQSKGQVVSEAICLNGISLYDSLQDGAETEDLNTKIQYIELDFFKKK